MADELVIVTVGVVIALAFVGLLGAYSARYKRVPPGHAMVVYGRRFASGNYMVLTGGGRFIQPIIESYALISLEPIAIDMLIEDVAGSVVGPEDQGRRLQLSLTAVAKISDDVNLLKASAGQLIHKTPEEIRKIAEATLEGHARGVLATEPSPQRDMERVARIVQSRAVEDLAIMGIEIRSVFLKIRDSTRFPGRDSGPAENVNWELHQLDVRVRRIEEKLGLSASGRRP